MTKKDYEMVAKAIAETNSKDALVNELCHIFKADNTNFDTYKFRQACEKHKPSWTYNIIRDMGI